MQTKKKSRFTSLMCSVTTLQYHKQMLGKPRHRLLYSQETSVGQQVFIVQHNPARIEKQEYVQMLFLHFSLLNI